MDAELGGKSGHGACCLGLPWASALRHGQRESCAPSGPDGRHLFLRQHPHSWAPSSGQKVCPDSVTPAAPERRALLHALDSALWLERPQSPTLGAKPALPCSAAFLERGRVTSGAEGGQSASE